MNYKKLLPRILLTDKDTKTVLGIRFMRMPKKYPNIYNYLLNAYDDCVELREILYRLKHNIDIAPKCPVCGNRLKFYRKTYQVTCSLVCASNYVVNREKIKQTCLNKFGGVAPACSKDIQYKIKQTCLERYGDENYNNNEKRKETCLKRYGAENVFASEYGKQKTSDTCKQKYGFDWYVQTNEFKIKCKETSLEKHGVEYPMQNSEIKNKMIIHNIIKFGGCSPMSSNAAKEKFRKNSINKYGVDWPAKSEIIQEKIKQTKFDKHGSITYNNFEKFKQSSLIMYGFDNPMKNESVKQKGIETKRMNHSFNTSKIEEETYALLCNHFGINDITRQYKSQLYPWRCDFYIKSIDTYIEIQGNFTHGYHPYNPNDIDDQNTVKEWTELGNNGHPYYLAAIINWTVTDPLKRNTANANRLNYLEFWNIEELKNWLSNNE